MIATGAHVTEETTSLAFLLSAPTLILALAAFYIARSLWIARREWAQCRTDSKILYLLVAPPLTAAVDLLEVTDRLFWSREDREMQPVRAHAPAAARRVSGPLRPKIALRSDG